jgi:hypothetical protein
VRYDDGWLRLGIILPRAPSQHAHARTRVKEARLAAAFNQVEPARNEIPSYRLRVSVLQSGMRDERMTLEMLYNIVFGHR